MKPLRIPAGTKVLLGAPAAPLPKRISDAIGEMASRIPKLIEAHLPQCFAVGAMNAPAQILVVVVDTKGSIGVVLEAVSRRLAKILPNGMHLDVWPIDVDHPSLTAVRNTDCRIF